MARDGAQGWRWLGWLILPAASLVPEFAGGEAGPVRLAATLTLLLATALLSYLVLHAVREGRRGHRFLLLWASAGAAALLVAGVIEFGGLWGAAGPVSGRASVSAVAATVAVAARWTLTSGLVAAAVTAWLAPWQPQATAGAPRYLRIGVAATLLLATIWSAGNLARATAMAGVSDKPAPAVQAPTAPASVPSADPSDPPLPRNARPDRAFAGRCAESAVRVTYQGMDAAAGGRYALIAAVNEGAEPCVLKGFPDVAFADLLGNNVRVKLSRGGSSNGQKPAPKPVRLQPGGVAHAELSWRADAGAYDREVNTILIAGWAGAERTGYGGNFQVKNGTAVQVSPWLAGEV
nr:DUF4232 domain-containing protein [Propionicimonas sp.]